ncbi:hypothetical protein [Sulfuricurvum sp.]|uniref:hypothetical protein n=1 Tax=Sulfuricurvum sp. TaxID=2025608 RepID=UPI003BAE8A40
MAAYTDSSNIRKVEGTKEWWQNTYSPGTKVPISGIYKCLGCGDEIASNKGDPFPPQNHHQHLAIQGHIKWKLIVRTENPK